MKHLFDDPAVPPESRDDLDLQGSRVAGEASASGSAHAAGPSGLTRAGHSLSPWTWKLALLVAIGGAGVATVWLASRPAAPPPDGVATTPAPGPAAAIDRPTPATAPSPATTASSPAASESRREIEQIERIRALIETDPTAAYQLAQRGAVEFPGGVLTEERQALEIIGLAKTGSVAMAERKAQRFFAHYPQSPMRDPVQAALKR